MKIVVCDYPECGIGRLEYKLIVVFSECNHHCCIKHLIRDKNTSFDEIECGVCANEKTNEQLENVSIDRGGGSL